MASTPPLWTLITISSSAQVGNSYATIYVVLASKDTKIYLKLTK